MGVGGWGVGRGRKWGKKERLQEARAMRGQAAAKTVIPSLTLGQGQNLSRHLPPKPYTEIQDTRLPPVSNGTGKPHLEFK